MLRQKTYSLINIGGLAAGMGASLIIFLWVRDELGFNRYHENLDRIHFVVSNRRNRVRPG